MAAGAEEYELSELANELFNAVAMPDVLTAELDVYESSDGPSEIRLLGYTRLPDAVEWTPETGGSFDVSLYLRDREVHVDTLDVPRAWHHRGVGRTCMLRIADVGRYAKCDAMRVMASKDGRYAWARCGFAFDAADDRERVVAPAAEMAELFEVPFDAAAVRRPSDISDLPGALTRADLIALGADVGVNEIRHGRLLLLTPDDNEWFGRLRLRVDDPGYVQLSRYGVSS